LVGWRRLRVKVNAAPYRRSWRKRCEIDARPCGRAARQRAVIVRHVAAPRISDYLRITVGNETQIDRLLSALSDILVEGR